MRNLIFFILLLANHSLAAEGSKHTFRALFLDAPRNAPKKIFIFDGTTSQEIELPGANFSPVYELPAGDRTVVFTTTPYSTPEEVDPAAPVFKVPAATTDFYLLISSDPKNSVAPVQGLVVPVDKARFKNGEMMWFNLTPNAVGGTVGSQNIALRPQSQKLIEAPVKDKGYFDVELKFQLPNDKEVYPLCETKWIHDPRARMVVFVTNEGGRRTPLVRGFADLRVKKEGE